MAVTLIRGVSQADPGDNELFARWQDKLANAKERTHARSDRRGALIEVAAQHPLRDGLYPNAEFATRLDSAIALYRQVSEEEPGDVRIYVPGSVHMNNGIPDKVSLNKVAATI
jgi:hypothetical protein